MRTLARIVFVGVFAVFATVIGTVTALVTVAPGKDLLARVVTEESNRLVRGSVSIGKIRGNFLSGLTLDSVVVRDTSDVVLADLPRLEVQFHLADLLARRLVFHGVRVASPRVSVVKHRDGRMNYQEVLRLNEGPGGTGPGTLFRLEDLTIEGGSLSLSIPWNPDGRLTTDRQRDSALVAERARPGRRIEPAARSSDGLMTVRVIDQLGARFTAMRVSTPDRLPFATEIDSLSARVSDPGLTIAGLAGHIIQGGDSLLFDLAHAALPNTVAAGGGRIDWPRDTILYDFSLTADRLDLVDLRWISPDFPALTGRGRVTAKSVWGSRTEYDLRDLQLADRSSRVTGRLIGILDVYRGLGFRNLDLSLTSFDLEHVRPYLDTLPLAGRLTGPLQANGFFDRMKVEAAWLFEDARVEGGGANRLALLGDLTLGGAEGMVFHDTQIPASDLDLRTVRLVAPAVALEGRLALVGGLNGPLRNVEYRGRVEHWDGNRPRSAVSGRARLDTRGPVLAVDADLAVDTVAFEGIRRSFPTTPMLGRVGGAVRLQGRLDSLLVSGRLAGQIGSYRFVGLTEMTPPRWASRDLRIEFEDADLASLGGRGPTSRLAGRMELSGRVDSAAAPEAAIDLALTKSSIREFGFDSAWARFRIRDSVIVIDTAAAVWTGGGLSAAGGLGWAEPYRDSIVATGYALSLAPFDSLAAAIFNVKRADLTEVDLMSGRARAGVTVAGSLDQWTVAGQVRVDSAEWVNTRIRIATADYQIAGGRDTLVTLKVRAVADSVSRGKLSFADLAGEAVGRPDELAWWIRGNGTGVARVRARAGGQWRAGADAVRTLGVDSLAVDLLGRTWRLERPTTFTLDTATVADTVAISTADGSGALLLTGTLPGRTEGRSEVTALGVTLRDLYALAQRDTAGIGGVVSIDARLSGTLERPAFRGSASITGPVFGDVKAPLVRSVFNYQDRLLQSNLTFWRTGHPVLNLDASLPLDLGLGDVPRRQLPGELVIRGQADSVDLGVIEALTPNLRGVVGNLAVDAQVGGSWEAPRLGGFIAVSDAAAYVPGLRVSYGPINARLKLSGDSVTADGVEIRSGTGVATIGGGIRLEQLTRPTLGATVTATGFPLIDVPDYLTLHATGEVAVNGPLERPVMTGSVRATSSVLYFADLLTKDIVNLEDPANADLVDTTALRTQNLRAQFQSRILDSLIIRDLRFRVSEDVWLRSAEANVQLEGQVTVNKERRRLGRSEFRVSGQLNTPRGSYALKLGPVSRSFQVEQGTVQYFNTPDLNAALDLTARNVVRTVTSTGTDDYPIIARITGTLLVPKVRLESEPGRLQLPERDLVSLLVFGTAGSPSFANETFATSLAANLLSSELERRLVSSPNAAFDLIRIRPGFAEGNSAFSAGGSVTALSLGRQISNRLFVIFDLGGCFKQGDYFNRQYLGASLEYRLEQTLKLQIAAEPVQSCLSDAAASLVRASRYQFGADLKWDRAY